MSTFAVKLRQAQETLNMITTICSNCFVVSTRFEVTWLLFWYSARKHGHAVEASWFMTAYYFSFKHSPSLRYTWSSILVSFSGPDDTLIELQIFLLWERTMSKIARKSDYNLAVALVICMTLWREQNNTDRQKDRWMNGTTIRCKPVPPSHTHTHTHTFSKQRYKKSLFKIWKQIGQIQGRLSMRKLVSDPTIHHY